MTEEERAVRALLKFSQEHPYTGLADAPREVRRALQVLRERYPTATERAP